jgi:hypothetical protein
MRRALIASHYKHLLDEDEKDDVLYTLAVKRLALGQFELACGALAKLAHQNAARARQLLLDIVENGAPNDWLQSSAVACDAQLRWLAPRRAPSTKAGCRRAHSAPIATSHRI